MKRVYSINHFLQSIVKFWRSLMKMLTFIVTILLILELTTIAVESQNTKNQQTGY